MRKGPDNSYRLRPTVYKEAVKLAYNLLESPKAWIDHCRMASVGTVMGMTYGKIPGSTPDQEKATIKDVTEFVLRLTEGGRPQSHLVDIFPWLRFIPTRYDFPFPRMRRYVRYG